MVEGGLVFGGEGVGEDVGLVEFVELLEVWLVEKFVCGVFFRWF